ncbi:MAG: alpha/beta fold hydrolase, partial [Burkholderiales bacterium]|nr:alpha/beta fold hydrolase [Burkholderiales bacterium]
PILMIMGLGQQLTAWPPALLDALAGSGLAPVVFDNRDIGLSTKFDQHGIPNLLAMGLLHALHLPVSAPYRVADMAADTAGLLSALGIARAHVLGVSMGGMIAQALAMGSPERVASLTLVMTSSGDRRLPGPRPHARRALLARPRSRDLPALVEHGVSVWRAIGSPAYPPDDAQLRAKVERAIRRSYHPQGMARQLAAITASGDRSPGLGAIRAPTLVIHGREDPLVRHEHGQDLARKIPGAQLELVDGMGHDLPAELMPRLAARIAAHCGAAG